MSLRLSRVLAGALAAAVVGVGMSACSSDSTPTTTTSSSTTLSDGSTTTTTEVPPPTTIAPTTTTTAAPAIPTGLQASASDAASALVSAWANGNQARALSVATAPAVSSLFAAAYPGGDLAIPRGCSSAFPPLVCTYGPPGGGPTNAPIYQIYASQASGGWYVSKVIIEGGG